MKNNQNVLHFLKTIWQDTQKSDAWLWLLLIAQTKSEVREVFVHVSSLLYFIYIFACRYIIFSSFHLNFPIFLLFVRKIKNTCTDHFVIFSKEYFMLNGTNVERKFLFWWMILIHLWKIKPKIQLWPRTKVIKESKQVRRT